MIYEGRQALSLSNRDQKRALFHQKVWPRSYGKLRQIGSLCGLSALARVPLLGRLLPLFFAAASVAVTAGAQALPPGYPNLPRRAQHGSPPAPVLISTEPVDDPLAAALARDARGLSLEGLLWVLHANEHERTRQFAAASLKGFGSLAVPALANLASNKSERGRAEAIVALGLIGKPAAPSAPILGAAVKDSEASPAAVWALGAIGDAGVPYLTTALRTGDAPAVEIADALERIGQAAGTATSPLVDALCDRATPRDGRRRVAIALGKIGTGPKVVVPALTAGLDDPDEIVRNDSTEALGIFALRMETEQQVEAIEPLQAAREALKRSTGKIPEEAPSFDSPLVLRFISSATYSPRRFRSPFDRLPI